MQPARIILVGDYDPEVTAHAAINQAVKLFNSFQDELVEAVWVATDQIQPGNKTLLNGAHGIWCVPTSPYRNTAGALWAIQFARTEGVPFLGTCGGYQHALLEYARHVLGLTNADHQELRPDAKFSLLTRLACPMVEKSEAVFITGQNLLRKIYGESDSQEPYRCSYGLNPAFESLFQNGSLEIAARSPQGMVRAVVLKGHPFFVGVGYQPERKALEGGLHPVVRAFFRAARDQASGVELVAGVADYFQQAGETATLRFLSLMH
jgi:CTP synthase (UTP-ammonia lyase)